jgi:hypothetical protein
MTSDKSIFSLDQFICDDGLEPLPDNLCPRVKPLRHRKRAKRCFELSGVFVLDNPDWILLHAATALISLPGCSRLHAFAEKGNVVYDPVINKFYDKERYYLFHKVRDARFYTVKELANFVFKTNQWGPWDE